MTKQAAALDLALQPAFSTSYNMSMTVTYRAQMMMVLLMLLHLITITKNWIYPSVASSFGDGRISKAQLIETLPDSTMILFRGSLGGDH